MYFQQIPYITNNVIYLQTILLNLLVIVLIDVLYLIMVLFGFFSSCLGIILLFLSYHLISLIILIFCYFPSNLYRRSFVTIIEYLNLLPCLHPIQYLKVTNPMVVINY